MIINTLERKKFIKNIFNFIYFLRYLILIFIISSILLLTAPKLFKHVNKIEEINYLLKNQHGFIIKNSDKIKYKIFPQPNLEITDASILINDQSNSIKIKELKIYVNLKGMYKSKTIILKKINYKLDFFGNEIIGNYLPKEDINLLKFKIEKLGIKSKVFLDNKKILPKFSGLMKLTILDDNLVINFDYDQNLKINNSVYKNKNIYTNLKGQLNFDPFFYFNVFADIKKINLEKIKLKKIYKIIIDEISNNKLNGDLTINLNQQNMKNVKDNIIYITFKNGDIILKNSFLKLSNLKIKMTFYLKKYQQYKDLSYELKIETENINNFFKTINIKKVLDFKKMNALIKGNVNLDAQKYYFNEITINKKNLSKKKLKELKKYFEENIEDYFSSDLNKKNTYLFLKNLFEFI